MIGIISANPVLAVQKLQVEEQASIERTKGELRECGIDQLITHATQWERLSFGELLRHTFCGDAQMRIRSLAARQLLLERYGDPGHQAE